MLKNESSPIARRRVAEPGDVVRILVPFQVSRYGDGMVISGARFKNMLWPVMCSITGVLAARSSVR
jgi:hypothetical protein